MNRNKFQFESLMTLMIGLLLSAVIIHVSLQYLLESPMHKYNNFGDNSRFIKISEAISTGDFNKMYGHNKHFWGFPAVLSLGKSILPFLEPAYVIQVISLISSVIVSGLLLKIFGFYPAFFFTFLSWDWLQRSTIGGSEPLFLVVTYFAIHKLLKNETEDKNNIWATSIAAIACTVRPVGIFLLFSIGVEHLLKKNYKELFVSIFISAVIGSFYCLILYHFAGDPFLNFNTYRSEDWTSESPISLPFVNLIKSCIELKMPLLNTIKISLWLIFSIIGLILGLTVESNKKFYKKYPFLKYFLLFHLLFLYCYNSEKHSWIEFPRFLIPVLPLLMMNFVNCIKPNKILAYLIFIIGNMFAVVSTVSIYKIFKLIS